MEYVVLGLLIFIIVLLIIILLKSKDDSSIVEKLGKYETTITKEIGDFKFDFSNGLRNDFED